MGLALFVPTEQPDHPTCSNVRCRSAIPALGGEGLEVGFVTEACLICVTSPCSLSFPLQNQDPWTTDGVMARSLPCLASRRHMDHWEHDPLFLHKVGGALLWHRYLSNLLSRLLGIAHCTMDGFLFSLTTGFMASLFLQRMQE